jgi:signal transduction histidine kinase/ActR/RegA family two-component response regulator
MPDQGGRRRFLFVALAGVLGFLANSHRSVLLGDMPLLLGGVFGLTAAILLGPWYGAVAAALAALPALLIWNRPYLFVVFTLEAIAVGYLARRRWKPLVADAVYWAAAGVPVLIIGLHVSRAAATQPLWLLVTNVPSNGLINVLLAEILAAASAVRQWVGDHSLDRPSRRLRAHLAHAFLLVAMVPAFLLILASDRIYGDKRDKAERARLEETTAAIQQNVDEYVIRHQVALASLAHTIELDQDFDDGTLGRWIAAWYESYPGFQTLTLANQSGTSIAQQPTFIAAPNGPVLLIKDRAYFQVTLATGRPQVSDVIWGRVSKQPIVTLTSPVFTSSGQLFGVLIGSLKLNEFVSFGKKYPSLRSAAIVITDGSGHVIYSSQPERYQTMQSLSGTPLLASAARKESTSLIGDGSPGNELNMVSFAACNSVPWKIFLEEPLAALHVESDQYYRLTLACLLCAIAASLLLVRTVSASVTDPLELLVARVRAFKIGSRQEPLKPARAAAMPMEVAQLLEDFESMSGRLNQSYVELQAALTGREQANRQLQEVLKNLDAKVQERTAQLSDAAVRAEEASRSKSLFLANMSHEIRTPMNGVLGLTELVLASELSEDQRQHLQLAHSSAEALLALLNDILDFSKIEAGKLELESVPFSLRECVGGAVRTLEFLARQKGLDLSLTIAPEAPDQLIGDPHRLRQVLLNLTNNAIKFTSRGFVRVEVTDAGSLTGDVNLRFAVRDSGIGIAASEQQFILEPFRQADQSVTRQYGGTGLGLAICSSIVALWGGRMSIESEAGEGSTFAFDASFPRAGSAVAPAPMEHPADRIAESANAHARYRILVAEDNRVNQLLIERLLARENHIVTMVSNGREAIEALHSSTFDIVLMDVQMPEMDGFETVARWREREASLGVRLPVVAMTAHAMSGDREKCLEAGMDGYVSKPIQPAKLFESIEQAIASARDLGKQPAAPALFEQHQ